MTVEHLIEEYKSIPVNQVVDFDKFNHIAIVHHSTAIEGSTLTEVETEILINEGLTPRGKPLVYSLMTKDHFDALMFVLKEAQNKTKISVSLIQKIAGMVLRHTGSVYETALGKVDSSKGEFRKGNVRVGASSFPNYNKVPLLVNDLLDHIQNAIKNDPSIDEQLDLSFDAHFHLVSIHPFYDGNGRTSRLLMNYIQRFYDLPLAIVNVESRADYFQAIIDARKNRDVTIFRTFMKKEYAQQLLKEMEITKAKDGCKPLWREQN